MKTKRMHEADCPRQNHYQRLIQQATGAPLGDLAHIENIMREEIFHGTLDWQTRGRLANAARLAQRRLEENRELYDLERACRAAVFQRIRAEAGLREADTAAHRAAVATADAAYEAAMAKLFARLNNGEVN